ncbi:uncharacterized protein TRUGW13939_06834 [Talaromyces rugulosus]|uniref:FAD-binding domain-containing protein n=1 Tax=Talaromyces rugulosus TaxID=121627 RepID=A0A7H8QZX7_TALRU|nr:uncharacterized protein TRUGW13939_06834 [Talaromyces rugulosus]QKX59694.1 hypothetical protein TRUGW13939_06834 [Talaromyces rugulosus]
MKVLIIGAGSTGLALAHGLHKEDVEYTVFERDSEYTFFNKARDWGMQLHWGKEHLFKVLPESLRLRFDEVLVDPHFKDDLPFPHINGETGEVIAEIRMPGLVRVSRGKLRKLLSGGQQVTIQFEKKLVDIVITQSGVVASFSDGTQYSGDLLVGCDGSHSKVREYLVGADLAKPVDIDLTMINHAVSGYTASQAHLLRKYHPIGKLGYDPQIYGIFLLAVALDCSNLEKPEEWKFQIQHSWWGAPRISELNDPKKRLQFYKGRCSKLCEPFRTAALALSDDIVLSIDQSRQWAPIKWDNRGGRVTLAGDAAHSMLPHRGQGLNNAMQDTGELYGAIKAIASGKSSLEPEITSYENAMRPRGVKDVDLSLETGQKMHVSYLQESPFLKMGFHKPKGA